MLTTRTGSFPIGFRRGWGAWQRDLATLTPWAKENGFSFVDFGPDADQLAAEFTASGLKIGSADLKDWRGLITADAGKRKETVAKNAEMVAACSKFGINNYFVVMLPDDAEKSRSENFALMVEGLNELVPHLEEHGARIVIEGWPGPGALCCTPEGYRAVIRAVPSASIGINYDPSHLIRMGINPIRFLEEFAFRVYHVHGKDTELFPEDLYEFGTEQPATFAKGHGFGAHHWRYTIPGHGEMRWTRAFEILKEKGFDGPVSIELEDENFNGSDEGEQAGLLAGGAFLASC
ncbi:MAG TPA: sugar phosphate isomerase/epimerase [Fimbriimonas sp.]|nr:sugar phosphate isomerase/epimerase [Fimbriimonas sp.]